MPSYQTEKDLCGFLDKLDGEIESSKGDLNKRVEDNLSQIRGKQWKGDRAPYFLYNVIESALEDKTGKLSESKPKINVLPTRDGLDAPAEVLRKVISSVWDRRKIEYETERIAYWGAVAGVAFVGTPYNRRLNNGIGDIDFIVKDPRACGVDPMTIAAKDVDGGEYVMMEDFCPLDYVRSEFPGRGALVEPNERLSGYDRSAETKTPAQMLKGVYSRLFKSQEPGVQSAIPRTVLQEYFIKDRRKSIEDDGVVPITETTTKWCEEKGVPFPGGRRIIRAGKIILHDGVNEYWDGAPPIDALTWKLDLESMWGPDEIQGVKRMQEAVNRLGDAYTKNAIINSVVRVVMDYGALSPDERNKLSNAVGEIIEKAPGRQFEYQVPPTLPVEIVNFTVQMMAWIREKMGAVIPPTQKDVPSIVTGPALEGLQLMVQGPIRTAARRIEEAYARIGQKMVSRVFQYYTSDRIIHLVGPSQEWMQFEFKRKNLILDSKGNPRTQEDLRKAFSDFHFVIEPGSSLAATRTQRAMVAFQLSQAGMLSPLEVLKELGYLNPEEKMKQAQAARGAGLIPDPQNAKSQNSQSMGQGALAA